VCIFTQSTTHIIVDVGGYFPAGSDYQALVPARLLETRSGLSTIDGQFNGLGTAGIGAITPLQVTGRGGVPAGASTVVLNVTVTGPTVPGYVTVYPCGIDPPLASNLNFVGGQTVANAVIVKLSGDGKVCLFTSNATELIADVNGYLP